MVDPVQGAEQSRVQEPLSVRRFCKILVRYRLIMLFLLFRNPLLMATHYIVAIVVARECTVQMVTRPAPAH